MRTFKFIILSVLSSFIAIGCSNEYDDSELWDKVNSLDERIKSIEEKIESMNKGITSMVDIVSALDKRLYITNITPQSKGYKIVFSDGSQITISDGKDGEDGKDGVDGKDAPIINVRLYEGRYYWTQTINGETDWLYDNEGNKVPASGMDAATPLLKVDSDGYWIISYDNGNTYARVLDENGNAIRAVGQDGQDGHDGKDGDSFFASVEIIGDELWLTLKDGSEIVLPIGKQSPYKAVDLGLSVKWASFNLGATVPEELGGLYFWGDPKNEGEFIDFEAPDLNNICETEYDIARQMWGGTWKMPSKSACFELYQSCKWTRTVVNGVEGMKVTGKNGNSIFLPATGYGMPKDGPYPIQTQRINTEYGYYWTGDSYKDSYGRLGYYLHFDKSNPSDVCPSFNTSLVKCAVRPVKE